MFHTNYHSFLKHNYLFFALAFLPVLLYNSCKGDAEKPEEPKEVKEPSNVGYIPQKDKLYKYELSKNGAAAGEAITKVTGTKDSVDGIKVVSIETLINDPDRQTIIKGKSFSYQGITTNIMYPPAMFTEVYNEVKNTPYLTDYELTGWPHYQTIDEKANTNSQMIFRGPDIRMFLKCVYPSEFITTQTLTVTYQTGNVTAIENITTPAGTFSCTKWEFEYETRNAVRSGKVTRLETLTFKTTVWYATGVGIVKSIESSGSGLSQTVLTAITNQAILMKTSNRSYLNN